MHLHGTIADNLRSAIASARRLRGQPVYKETLGFWAELLDEAQRLRDTVTDGERPALNDLVERLEVELADRMTTTD